MIDYRALGIKPPNEKTPEDLHRMCAWCNYSSVFNATMCMCLRPCGKPMCVQDVEEFMPPPPPRFS